ncbi:MAG: hypothetical protein AB7K04_14605 [Pseudorhodoplanes sp.]
MTAERPRIKSSRDIAEGAPRKDTQRDAEKAAVADRDYDGAHHREREHGDGKTIGLD